MSSPGAHADDRSVGGGARRGLQDLTMSNEVHQRQRIA
jgi:hypothetical protein